MGFEFPLLGSLLELCRWGKTSWVCWALRFSLVAVVAAANASLLLVPSAPFDCVIPLLRCWFARSYWLSPVIGARGELAASVV
jgi:hypothetical protein